MRGESSRAWSLHKSDRFKMDAETKKNRELANVAPGNYEVTLSNKKREPLYSMGAKFTEVDKRISVSPQAYNIPSRLRATSG